MHKTANSETPNIQAVTVFLKPLNFPPIYLNVQHLTKLTNRHLRIKHDESHLGPLANGVKVHPSVDERLSQVSAAGFQRVGSYGHRPLHLISLQKLHYLEREKVWGEILQQGGPDVLYYISINITYILTTMTSLYRRDMWFHHIPK